ncbi:MAG: PIN domain-containing protein [Microcystis viridis Mv_BB_P_19951000_S69]|uniref:PIN domain-containing protein n=1 Tax=Microcystis viridis Mv_BB_P_19951000_S68D TaxID=2486270 RepID=A0A552I8R0_MICVR|nr:MAG: PIN domain-containing protein [Microcystis viridis Mv_BB_P_19951000_S69]TRU72389.1 MAG: PIN domain-containing protein [Microcystis viridis Mv_BB_P_19951000_S68]TRU79854.1 MAG: PIN domain-containing protein [Microcystis viridis Mv_BB_P_19951000_S68D]TRU88902.1 MAG: PIN domain-containing protein [Microcystis viridis Mv_BB_P_19951000_S69D]
MNAGESQPFFIDSNIWLYRFIVNCSDPNAIPKQQIATNITNQGNLIISTQVVNEVCSNLIRKAGFNNLQSQNLLEELTQGCKILPVSLETLEYAVKLRDRYLISFWDSLIVASAVLGDATILYSEDMQDGLIINNSLQVINPFKDLNS